MPDLDLNQLAAIEQLKLALENFRRILTRLASSIPGRNPGAQNRITPPEQNRIIAREFGAWLVTSKLTAFLFSGARSDPIPARPYSIKEFNGYYLAFRAQLPGLLSAAKVNPGEAGAILAAADVIYTKFVLPFKDTEFPVPPPPPPPRRR